jgi:hypothetical protein
MTEGGFRSEQGWLDRVIAAGTRRDAARTSSLRRMSPTFITFMAQRAFTVRLPVSTVSGKAPSAVKVGGSEADRCTEEGEAATCPDGQQILDRSKYGDKESWRGSQRGMCLHDAGCCASDDIGTIDERRQHAVHIGSQKRCNRTPTPIKPYLA